MQAVRSRAPGLQPPPRPPGVGWPPRTESMMNLIGQGLSSSSAVVRHTWASAHRMRPRCGQRYPETRPAKLLTSPRPRWRRAAGHSVAAPAGPRRGARRRACPPAPPSRGVPRRRPRLPRPRRPRPGPARRAAGRAPPRPPRRPASRERAARAGARTSRAGPAARPDAAVHLEVPLAPALVHQDEVLARGEDLHHAVEDRLLLERGLGPERGREGALPPRPGQGLDRTLGHRGLRRGETADPPLVALERAQERAEVGQHRDEQPPLEAA